MPVLPNMLTILQPRMRHLQLSSVGIVVGKAVANFFLCCEVGMEANKSLFLSY